MGETATTPFLRPVWVTSWFAIGLGGLLLIALVLPIYGSPLPTEGWWALPALFGALLLFAYRSSRRRDGFTNQWAISSVTSPSCAVIYAVGAYLLLTRSFPLLEYMALGTAGAVCLGIIAWADLWSRRADDLEYRKGESPGR